MIGLLIGKTIKPDDALIVDIEGVNSIEDLNDLPPFFVKGETPSKVLSITVNGEEVLLFDRVYSIFTEQKTSNKGNQYNIIKSIAPKGGGGKVAKRPNLPAGAPA